MTKKQICKNHETIGVYGYGLVVAKHIEYGIEDFLYFVSYGTENPTYHKVKIRYDSNSPYIRFFGKRIKFDEIMRVV